MHIPIHINIFMNILIYMHTLIFTQTHIHTHTHIYFIKCVLVDKGFRSIHICNKQEIKCIHKLHPQTWI